MTTRFLARLLSLLVKRREEVITGKPKASNTFLIKTIYDRLKKQKKKKKKKKKNRNCKKKEEAKGRILYSRSSDYASRQVLAL